MSGAREAKVIEASLTCLHYVEPPTTRLEALIECHRRERLLRGVQLGAVNVAEGSFAGRHERPLTGTGFFGSGTPKPPGGDRPLSVWWLSASLQP